MPKGMQGFQKGENNPNWRKGKNNLNWKGGKVEIVCRYCGNVREVFPYVVKNGFGKYCSRKCYWLAKKGMKRKPFTKKHLNNKSESMIRFLSSGKRKYKNTGIELKIEEELKKVELNYQKQVAICKVGMVDFFIPEYNIIIECDGDYFHNFPKVKQKDATKDLVWMFNNYKVFRFWGHEINESPKKCIKAVLKYIKFNRLFQNKLKIVK